MGRIEKRIFRLNDEIAALAAEEHQVAEELSFHRHLHDDAHRDAVVSGHPLDRADARETSGDVARFESVLADLRKRRERLIHKRDNLIRRLG